MSTLNGNTTQPYVPPPPPPPAEVANTTDENQTNPEAAEVPLNQWLATGGSIASWAAQFHSPESMTQWRSGGNELALNSAGQTPANTPNTANSPQFVTPSTSATGKSDYQFVGGVNVLNVDSDVDPNAANLRADAANGTASATQFKDKNGDTIHVLRTPAPYYIDKDGNQQTLQLGQQAPKDAKYAYYDAYQETMVRELKGEELGLLQNVTGPNDPKLKSLLQQVEAKNEAGISDATGGKFKTLEEARAFSRQEGYYGSGAHIAAANSASARTGGRIPAEWFMEQDPFMGRAGSNQQFFPTRSAGMYPGVTSKIGVAHDADYGLGANFKAGPLKDLYGRTDLKGYEGLDGGLATEVPHVYGEIFGGPKAPNYEQYGTGHKDWSVENVRGEETRIAAGSFLGIGLPAPNPDLNAAIQWGNDRLQEIGEGMSGVQIPLGI
jgi:hypothetical protein